MRAHRPPVQSRVKLMQGACEVEAPERLECPYSVDALNRAEPFRVELPLVPPRIYPDGHLRLPFKELAEEFHNLGVARELLEGFSALPFIDAQEVSPILGTEDHFVREVSRGLGLLSGRSGDLVMQRLGALWFGLEPRTNGDDNGHVPLLFHTGFVNWVRAFRKTRSEPPPELTCRASRPYNSDVPTAFLSHGPCRPGVRPWITSLHNDRQSREEVIPSGSLECSLLDRYSPVAQ